MTFLVKLEGMGCKRVFGVFSKIQMHFTEFFLQLKTHHWNLYFASNTPARGHAVEVLQLGLLYGKGEKQYLLNT